jgi:tetraacyldisaccharide-1-P 4'-kinase
MTHRIIQLPDDATREKIFQLAAQGNSVLRISKEIQLDERTVRAVTRMPDFRARMIALRADIIDVGRARLHAQVELAVVKLGQIIAGGEGTPAQVRAILAVLDRVGLTAAMPSRQPESERVLHAVVRAIADHPAAREAAALAIEADIVDP